MKPPLPFPRPQPCDCESLQTLKQNHKSQAPALIGLVLCLSLATIPNSIKNLSVCDVNRQISLQKSVNGKNRENQFRRVHVLKASIKPYWKDGFPNSAKKRMQHRRRGLFLREPHVIWGLGFAFSGRWSPQRRRGLHRASVWRVLWQEYQVEDKEEMGIPSLWGFRFHLPLLRNSRLYFSSYNNCNFKLNEMPYEALNIYSLWCWGLSCYVCYLLSNLCFESASCWAIYMEKGNQAFKFSPYSDKEFCFEQAELKNLTKEHESAPTMDEEAQNSSALYNKTDLGPLGTKTENCNGRAILDMVSNHGDQME